MTSVDRISRQIHLANRPTGWPTHDDFREVEVELPELDAGQVRVRNEVLSVDPYMRGRMNEGRAATSPPSSSTPSWAAPRSDGSSPPGWTGLAEGDLVSSQLGWRDVAQASGRAFQKVPEVAGGSRRPRTSACSA